VKSGRATVLTLAVLVCMAAAGGVARGELAKSGDVVVSFDGGISPRALPRSGVAPVAVGVESAFRSFAGADPPPQLRRISIAINRRGRLFNRGLPTCRVRRIQPATIGAARRICGGAIVGQGRVGVRVNLAGQKPFDFSGRLLAFNAKPGKGGRRILAQVYGIRPPSAFVLTFRIQRRPGTFGTVIETVLPHSARGWAYVTRFEMTLRRTYVWGGKRRSYLSAGCPAPPGFPGAIYPFARAEFDFAGGQRVVSELNRSCSVR
jgi:hypothetical protein